MDKVDSQDLRSFAHDSPTETETALRLTKLLATAPIPPEEMINNLPLFLRRHQLTDLLSMDALYRQVLDVPGVIMEFGVRYGRHLATFAALRGVYEPYNPLRRVVGFDTFTGFPDLNDVDRVGPTAYEGRFATPQGYPTYLREILEAHEQSEFFGHVTQRSVLVQGDVRETVPRYLEENPQTVIALAYLDLDLYEPTRAVLEAILPRLTRGSIVAFDEVDNPKWPGENVAVREVLGLDHAPLRLLPGRPAPAYLVWGD
ncbi:class I SAM-dependent methyltransferase [Salinispora sp. H7-4]|uniref:class I SAM-dependent methyltransferase n=1 Tax=Salinispora sp. H7-4 TaxID=2748321 RepID=UPI0015D1BCEB|nr:class I SAM-dependent methyltransferase [Salinispora sp. H7-4]NYT92591.1 class I SAM-dependent methyltransferase [Salinispora sp. H7-4]